MNIYTKTSEFFVAGGTLRPDAPSYVKRPADDELFHLASASKFCYVLTPRQMGKSSLMVRTARRLQREGVRTAVIDLTKIGTDLSVEQWYLGLITRLKVQLEIPVDPETWWVERASLSAVQRFTDFLYEVVLAEIEGPVVIFVDEIDTTLNLDFSDDFFAAIRFAYNTRASDPAYRRLTFVLLGVAAPADLIKDPGRTPFNIGRGIDLGEFGWEDADVLRQGLKAVFPDEGEYLFGQIYRWTRGHPYLTQKLCMAVAEKEDGHWTDERLGELVERLFLSEEARKETNLQFVRDKILNHPQHRRLLALYRKVYTGKKVSEDERSPIQNQLKLSGLVKVENGCLAVRNEIYRRAFDVAWVKENTAIDLAYVLAAGAVFVALLVVGFVLYNRMACMLWPRERWCPQGGPNLMGKTIFALASCDDGTLFAGAEDGIYRRAPGDNEWKLEKLTNGETRSLAASPECRLVYAAAPNLGVLKRCGDSWSEVSDPDMTRSWSVFWSGDSILAGGDFGARHSVADEAHTWAVPPVFGDTTIVNFARTSDRIYAAVWGGGVWYCNQGNLNRWKPIGDNPVTTYARYAIGLPSDDTTILMGTRDGFYIWNGTQWEKGPEPWGSAQTFWFLIDNAVVYGGQENNGVLRSTDDGLTWEQMNTGWETPPFQVHTLLIHSGEDGRRWLYAGTSQGVWRYLLPQPLMTPTAPSSPSPTATTTRQPTSTPTPLPMTPATTQPSSTPTRTPTSTLTPSPLPTVTPRFPPPRAVVPELIAPAQGDVRYGRDSITFEWDGKLNAGQAYQVNMRHRQSGYEIRSEFLAIRMWTAKLPEEKYGEWLWTVSVVQGGRTLTCSPEWMLWFDPYPGSGGEGPPPPTNTPLP